MAPKIIYWPVRGRAEVMKLAIVASGDDFELEQVDYEAMKRDTEHYPFGQAPRLVDGDVDMVQSNAICRYLARKYGLYGKTDKEINAVEEVLEGVEGIRGKYLTLIYQDKLADEPKATYWKTHGAPESAAERNGGAHLVCLSRLLARNQAAGGGKAMVGSDLTIADLAVFDIVDLHNRIFGEEMKDKYPDLLALHAHIAEMPRIKEYLAGPKRVAAVNGNDLG